MGKGLVASRDWEFEIELASRADGYQLRVRSPAGDADTDITFDPARLGVDLQTLQARVLASATESRKVPELEGPLRQVGQALFEAVFQASAGALFLSSRNQAEGANGRLRIVLRLRAPELSVLPWELLFSEDYGGYLCRRSPVVRYVDVAEPVRPLTVTPPLRILGMTALPGDMDALEADTEQDRLQQLLAPLTARELVTVDWVPGQSWEAAQEALYRGCDVFHFIGHGGFDSARNEGVIAFANEQGHRQLVAASALADLLSVANPMPRLVLLNSCQTGTGADVDVFSSTAATLVRTVPAVVAMQFAITDDAAAIFSRAFYQALVHNLGVDEAVRAGRIRLTGWNADTLEWVTPVLYLRSPDTRLFDFPQDRIQPPHEAVLPSGRKPLGEIKRHWPGPNFNLPSPLEQQRFVGRDRELTACREKLAQNGFLIIHGLDGQGKTTLAKVYAAEWQDDYDLIWFVPASHESGVSARLEALASKLEVVTASEPDAAELRYLLRKELEASDRWLLIFDDVRDWSSIKEYIPPVPPLRGHIIATTQETRGIQDIPNVMPGYLALGPLPLAVSKKYLLDHIEGATAVDAERLARDLGCLASALEFAAMKYAPTGIPETRGTPTEDAIGKLHILWKETFDQLQTSSPLAYSLLEVCSLFASDPIPDAILTLPPRENKPIDELRGALTDTSRYSDFVITLRERSLLDAPPGSHAIIVHSLLQAYLRDRMAPDRRSRSLSVAIDLLQDVFYESWFADNYLRCVLALPHAEACLKIAEQDETASGETSTLMVRMAHYHRTRGEIFKARDLHERALKLRERTFGDYSREVARSLINLGVVLTEMGEPDEAIKRYGRSLGILTRAEPSDEELVAICRDDLGLALAAKGQYSQAIDVHMQAYHFWIRENPRHSDIAQILDNMGRVLYLLGELSQAEKLLHKALEIGREALDTGFGKLALAGMLHTEGQILRARSGVYDAWRAGPLLAEALSLRSGELGNQHLSVIETRTALARVFRCTGEYAKADEELKSASHALDEIRRSEALGFGPPGSPDLSSKYECAVLVAEGELRFALGNYAGAKQSLQRAQELAKEGIPLPAVEHAELLENLGRVYNAESPSAGKYLLEQAAATRDGLSRARSGMLKTLEGVDR
jgi:tetratricopeptide (TPR) repeat protein